MTPYPPCLVRIRGIGFLIQFHVWFLLLYRTRRPVKVLVVGYDGRRGVRRGFWNLSGDTVVKSYQGTPRYDTSPPVSLRFHDRTIVYRLHWCPSPVSSCVFRLWCNDLRKDDWTLVLLVVVYQVYTLLQLVFSDEWTPSSPWNLWSRRSFTIEIYLFTSPLLYINIYICKTVKDTYLVNEILSSKNSTVSGFLVY